MNKQTDTQSDTMMFPACFSQQECYSLWLLRTHYAVCRDLLAERELRHLRFVRWLYRTGRLTP